MPCSSMNIRLLFLLLFCASPLLAAETSEQMSEPVAGQQLKYIQFLPQQVAEKGWPVMLFLHGSGERGTELNKVKVHGPPKVVGRTAALQGMVILAPQCPAGERWQADTLKALVDEVLENHGDKIDQTRLYITGLSMGGYGTWDFISRYPTYWSAAAPICGGGDIRRLKRYQGTPIEDPFEIHRLKQATHLPIWAFHGDGDKVVPPEESRLLVEFLKQAGSKQINYTEYPGVGHAAWNPAYDDPALYDWLLEQTSSK